MGYKLNKILLKMYIKLEYKSSTEKAYLLKNGGWIPKSVLNRQGLTGDYYSIESWFISSLQEKIFNKKATDNDIYVTRSLESMVKTFTNLPKEQREKWLKYNSDCSYGVEYEPRLWGNDCFAGEMSSWF